MSHLVFGLNWLDKKIGEKWRGQKLHISSDQCQTEEPLTVTLILSLQVSVLLSAVDVSPDGCSNRIGEPHNWP